MSRLSIIIPCLGSAEQFESTLVSVLQNRPEPCEVLVAHAGPYGDPYDLSGEVRFVEVPSPASWIDLANAALEAAGGEVVHLLQCGLEVEEGWTEAALQHFEDPRVGAVVPLLLDADRSDRLLAAGVRYGCGGRRQVVGPGLRYQTDQPLPAGILGPTLWTGFYRSSAVAAVGRFAASVGEVAADVDLALSLRAAGYRPVCEPASRVFGQRSALARPAGKASLATFAAGRGAERLFWRHAPATGWTRSLLMHPFTVAADLLTLFPSPRTLSHLLGRAVACLEIPAYRRHYRRMGQAAVGSPRARPHPPGLRIDPPQPDDPHPPGSHRPNRQPSRAA